MLLDGKPCVIVWTRGRRSGTVRKSALMRVADGDEKAEWWKRATEVWPAYDDYQSKTDRAIPLVVLDPA